MSKEQLLQELAEAFEKLIRTATEADERGVTRQGDRCGAREIVAHLAGWGKSSQPCVFPTLLLGCHLLRRQTKHGKRS